MKVLAVIHGYVGGSNPLRAGAENMVHAMLRYLVERGHTVDVVITPNGRVPEHDYEIDGVHVYGPGHDLPTLLDAADVAVTHLDATNTTFLEASRAGTPVIVVEHNDHIQSMRLLRQNGGPRGIVFNSEWMRGAYHTVAIAKESLRGVHEAVVRPPVFSQGYVAEGPHDKVTMVNLFKNKGALVFWALAAAMPDVQFLAIRGGYGAQVIPDVIPENVELIGGTDDMREVYARTAILLMPSYYESWGRVAVEAAASGIPTIAAPTVGLTEALGVAGVFRGLEDPRGWVSAIRELLTNPDAMALAQQQARRRSAELDQTSRDDLVAWEELAIRVVSRRPKSHDETGEDDILPGHPASGLEVFQSPVRNVVLRRR